VVSQHPEHREVFDRLRSPLSRQLSSKHESTQHLDHLDVHELRRVSGRSCHHSLVDAPTGIGAQQQLDHRRGVDDDHAESRSLRTAAAADSASFTDFLARRRSRISSGVGNIANLAISASRSSDRDMPACAARTFNFLCTASGTSRIWTVLAMLS
jgi:hypothetical protein